MATVFMTVYGKEGLARTGRAEPGEGALSGRRVCKPRFQRPVLQRVCGGCNGTPPEALNAKLLEHKIIGGLPLGRFYPELADCMLLCATEMTKREPDGRRC